MLINLPLTAGGARIEVSRKNPVFILVLGPNALTAYQLIRTCALIRQKSRIIWTRHCALCSGTPDKRALASSGLSESCPKSATYRSPRSLIGSSAAIGRRIKDSNWNCAWAAHVKGPLPNACPMIPRNRFVKRTHQVRGPR
jgi:hypothetical protein